MNTDTMLEYVRLSHALKKGIWVRTSSYVTYDDLLMKSFNGTELVVAIGPSALDWCYMRWEEELPTVYARLFVEPPMSLVYGLGSWCQSIVVQDKVFMILFCSRRWWNREQNQGTCNHS